MIWITKASELSFIRLSVFFPRLSFYIIIIIIIVIILVLRILRKMKSTLVSLYTDQKNSISQKFLEFFHGCCYLQTDLDYLFLIIIENGQLYVLLQC